MEPISANNKILDLAGGTDGVSEDIASHNYDVVRLTVITKNGYDGTLYVVGSDNDTPIDLSIPADENNQYAPVEVVDLDDQSVSLPGSTGLTFSQDGVKRYEINENRLNAFGVIGKGATQGDIIVYARQYNN